MELVDVAQQMFCINNLTNEDGNHLLCVCSQGKDLHWHRLDFPSVVVDSSTARACAVLQRVISTLDKLYEGL